MTIENNDIIIVSQGKIGYESKDEIPIKDLTNVDPSAQVDTSCIFI